MHLPLFNHASFSPSIAPRRFCCQCWNQAGFHLLAGLSLLAFLWTSPWLKSMESSKRIGQTVHIELARPNIGLLARVDTGATITSLHACNIRIRDGGVDYTGFTEDGNPVPMRSPFAKRAMIRSSTGDLFSKTRITPLTASIMKHVTAWQR